MRCHPARSRPRPCSSAIAHGRAGDGPSRESQTPSHAEGLRESREALDEALVGNVEDAVVQETEHGAEIKIGNRDL